MGRVQQASACESNTVELLVKGKVLSQKEKGKRDRSRRLFILLLWASQIKIGLGFRASVSSSRLAHQLIDEGPLSVYEQLLTLNAGDARAWFHLGYEGGGTVSGKPYSKNECYETSLSLDPTHAMAWANLGVVGGGTVSGTSYTEKDCF